MAWSFSDEIHALTGFDADSTSATATGETYAVHTTQWLRDSAKEVINVLPPRLLNLCASEQTFTSGTASTLNTGKILTVFRNDGEIDQPCREINPEQKGRYSDSSDMNKATITDPVYFIENSTIDALPAGGSCKFSEVQYPSINYSDSSIGSTSLTGVTATAADPTVFTKSSHGLTTGDVVKLSNFTEMTEVNGMIGTVTKLNGSTFEVNGVAADPAETTGGNVVQLGQFPDEAERAVVLGAAIKAAEYMFAHDQDIELTGPIVTGLKGDYQKVLEGLATGRPSMPQQQQGGAR
jgi:hypothetical protein